MEPIVNFYPVFEPDQVLTSENLNAMVNYLEQQERLTRNKLIGIGIVCGLELSNVKSPFTINISRGCGVTSAGYLIVQENAVLNKYTDYQDPAGYEHFSDNKGKQNIKLWELLQDEETREGKTISELKESTEDFKLDDMAVILYLEAPLVDMKTCTENDCDEKGKRREFTVRRLLISKQDLVKIINKCRKRFTPQSLTELKLKDSILAKYKLKELNIRRLSVTSNKIIEFDDLMNFYSESVNGFTDKVADALVNAHVVYKDILTVKFNNANPFANLKTKLNTYRQDAELNYYKLQYFYDFLKDLVMAYNEFRRYAFDLAAECCPDDSCFPLHLMINEAIVKNEDAHTIFRHYFIPSPALNGQYALFNKVLTLFIRLVDMCDHFSVPDAEKSKIKITPSREFTSLEERAIPYYYFNSPYSINKNWNYELKKKQKSEYNFSYNADKYVNEKAPDEVVNALEYNMDESSFLRIEGHVGKSFESVLKEINSQRTKYNLPFEIVGLKLSRDFSDTSATIKCLYRDLESIYNYLRSELICILTKEIRYFSGLNYRKDIIRTSGISGAFTINTNLRNINTAENTVYKNFMLSSVNGLVETDTLGEIYNAYYEESVKPYIGTYAYNFLKDKDLLNVLQQMNDIVLYFNYPLELMDNIEDIVKEIPVDANDFNLQAFTAKYAIMLRTAVAYRREVFGSTLQNKEELLDHLDKLYYDCSLTKFRTLFEDYKRRMDEILKSNLFYYFMQKHPGMEHKAGVNKGGTFIIVYADADDIEDKPGIFKPSFTFDREDLLAKFNSIGLLGEDAAVLSETIVTKAAESANISPGLLYNDLVKNVNVSEITNIKDFEANFVANNIIKLIRDTINKSNMIVVADFCLPYICCSDCPPIAYVIGSATETVTLSIKPNEFCSDDKGKYPFEANPPGGVITGQGVSNNLFSPSAVTASFNEDFKEVQFVYTTTDNRTALTSAKVFSMPQAKFEFRIEDVKGTTALVKFINISSSNSKTFAWDFGDGTTSAEKDPPSHKFELKKPGENVFTVELKVTNGVCTNAVKQEVRISAKPKTAVITIKNNEFCVLDQRAIEVTVEPDTNSGKLTANGVALNKTAVGKYIFVPSSVAGTIGNNSFINVKLEYKSDDGTTAAKDIRVFNMPKPEFRVKNIKVSSGNIKAVVTFANTSTFAVRNEWRVIRIMGNSTQDLGVLGVTNLNDDAQIEFDTTPGIIGYDVVLRVINGSCSKEGNIPRIKITELRGNSG